MTKDSPRTSVLRDAPKRYDLEQPTCHMGSAEMREDPLGDWVRFDEVQALIAEAVERATRVKPLVFAEARNDRWNGQHGYQIGWNHDDMFRVALVDRVICKSIKGFAAAVAWANKHNEQRIRAAIGGNDE
jgi:hypothetical protein